MQSKATTQSPARSILDIFVLFLIYARFYLFTIVIILIFYRLLLIYSLVYTSNLLLLCINVNYTTMDNTIPKFDLPEDWLSGTDISKELLGMYKNYPVRLKCEIIALCMDGEIEASVNLNHLTVRKNDIITLMPGSIFQINDLKGDLKIYFLGFSSRYIEKTTNRKFYLMPSTPLWESPNYHCLTRVP